MSGIRSFLLRHRLGTPSGEVCSTGSATYGYLFRLVRFESLILSKTGLQSFISWTTKAAGLIILLFLLSLSKGLICLFIGLLHRGIAWTSFFINIDQKLSYFTESLTMDSRREGGRRRLNCWALETVSPYPRLQIR